MRLLIMLLVSKIVTTNAKPEPPPVFGCPKVTGSNTLPGGGTPDWEHVRASSQMRGRCYYTPLRRKATYGGAEIYCRKHGAHLAMPKNDIIVEQILKKTQGNVWIGLDSIGTIHFNFHPPWDQYLWADGTSLQPEQIRRGGPNNDDTFMYVSCIAMNRNKKFEKRECDKMYEFVCETSDEEYHRQYERQSERCPIGWFYFDCGEYCYFVSDETVDRATASARCRDFVGEEVEVRQLIFDKTRRQYRAMVLIALHSRKRMSIEQWYEENWTAWIGLQKDDSNPKHWEDGSYQIHKVLHVNSYKVPSGSTAGPVGEHYCAAVNLDGIPFASNCNDKRHYICQRTQHKLQGPKCGVGPMRYADMYDRRKREGSMKEDEEQSQHATPEPSVVSAKSPASNLNIGRIVSGNKACIKEFPWAAKLFVDSTKKYKCGAVIISDKWVLTAAQCLLKVSDPNPLWPVEPTDITVGYGSVDSGWELHHQSQGINLVIHPKHNWRDEKPSDNSDNNLALIQVNATIPTDCPNSRPVCLDISLNKRKEHCLFIGFGRTPSLRKCRINDWQRHMFGVSSYKVSGDCQAAKDDIGSPVMCQADGLWRLLGIISDVRKEKNVVYTIFTEVETRQDWINTVIRQGKYTAYFDKLVFEDARASCKAKGGSLAQPRSQREDLDLRAAIRLRAPTDSRMYWMGLKRSWDWWYWLDDFDGEYHHSDYNCMAYHLLARDTLDYDNQDGPHEWPCNSKEHYVCEFLNGSYIGYDEQKTYWDAEVACRSKNGFLAEPRSQRQRYNMIQSLHRCSGVLFWYGLMRKGDSWAYSSGWVVRDHQRPGTFTNWMSGRPKAGKDNGCGVWKLHNIGTTPTEEKFDGWSNVRCNYKLPYVCEFPDRVASETVYTEVACVGVGDYMWILCGYYRIHVLQAYYIWKEARACNHVTQYNKQDTCSRDQTPKVTKLCTGKKNCFFAVKKGFGGYPCGKVRMMLEVKYRCDYISPKRDDTDKYEVATFAIHASDLERRVYLLDSIVYGDTFDEKLALDCPHGQASCHWVGPRWLLETRLPTPTSYTISWHTDQQGLRIGGMRMVRRVASGDLVTQTIRFWREDEDGDTGVHRHAKAGGEENVQIPTLLMMFAIGICGLMQHM